MTDDATDWAWRHARSRGNARLAVLAVAARTTGPDATARLGPTEAAAMLGGVGKGTVVKALADAVDAGDLEIIEPGKGRRPALYRLPGAIGYTAACGPDSRPQDARCGPDSRPQTEPVPPAEPLWSGFQTTNGLRSGSQTTTPELCGPDSRPQTLWDEDPEKCATRAQASFKAIDRESEGGREQPTPGTVPEFAAELVARITAARVYLPWTDLATNEWFRLDAMLKRSGVDMLAEHAADLAARQRAKGQPISSPRYLLRAWQSLPEAPPPGTVPATPTGPGADVIPLNPAAPRKGRAAQAADWYAEIIAQEQ